MLEEKSCGVIVYHKTTGERVYLVIQNKNGNHWDFPKGHQETGETDTITAQRELYEETGLGVELLKEFKESITYSPAKNINKTVIFFIGKTNTQDVTYIFDELQDHKWLPYDQARAQLTFDNAKQLLDKAEQFLKKHITHS